MFRKIIVSVFLFLFLLPSYEAIAKPYAYVIVPYGGYDNLGSSYNENYPDITVIDVDTNRVVGNLNVGDRDCFYDGSFSTPSDGLLTSTAGNTIFWLPSRTLLEEIEQGIEPPLTPEELTSPRLYRRNKQLVDAVVDSSEDRLYIICSKFVGVYGHYELLQNRRGSYTSRIEGRVPFVERENGKVYVIDISNIETDLAEAPNNVADARILHKIDIGDAPNDLVFSPDGRYIYVSNGNIPIDFNAPSDDPVLSSLTTIDTVFNTEPIYVVMYTDLEGNYPRDYSCRTTGTNCGDDPSSFTIIDTNNFNTRKFGTGQLVNPDQLAISPNGRYLFVADNDYHPLRDTDSPLSANHPDFSGTPARGFEKGNFNSVGIAIYDLSRLPAPQRVYYDNIDGRQGINEMIVSPDGTKLYVTFDPLVLRLAGNTVIESLDYRIGVYNIITRSNGSVSLELNGHYTVGSNPLSMAFDPDGGDIYISRVTDNYRPTVRSGVDTKVVSFRPESPFSGRPTVDTYDIIDQEYDNQTHRRDLRRVVPHQRKLAFSADGSKLFVTLGETSTFERFFNAHVNDQNDPHVVILDVENERVLSTINMKERNVLLSETINIALAHTETSSTTVEETDDAQQTETVCADGRDNDGDNQIDCADSDCADICNEAPEPIEIPEAPPSEGTVPELPTVTSSPPGVAPAPPTATPPLSGLTPAPTPPTPQPTLPGLAPRPTPPPATPTLPGLAPRPAPTTPSAAPPRPEPDRPPVQTDNPRVEGESGSSGGGGCTLAGSSTVGTTTANVLLPMMIFGLAFGLRRIRRIK